MFEGVNIVLAKRNYMFLAIASMIIVAAVLAITSNLVYITPAFYLNYGEVFREGIANVLSYAVFFLGTSIFGGLTIAMIAYKHKRTGCLPKKEAGFGAAGLSSAAFASACSSCVPLILYSAGVTYSVFAVAIAPYILQIRLISMLILFISFYYASKSIASTCRR